MTQMDVFDPPMCCSSGVCGPEVDPLVAAFAADVDWLTSQGVRFAPGGIRRGGAGFDICFVHPKGNDEFPVGGEGVLIELVQAPPEVTAAFQALAARSF